MSLLPKLLISLIVASVANIFPVAGEARDKTLLRPEVIGKDDRVPLDSVAYPWSAIGRVNLEIGGYCTGTVIAPGKVLTAAHCLWNTRTRRWYPARFLHFVAGYRRGEFLVHSRVEFYSVNGAYVPRNPLDKVHPPMSQNDWAVLTLKKDVTPQTGTVPLGSVRRNAIKDFELFRKSLTQAGYSMDRAHLLTMHQGCSVNRASRSRDILYHDCDTTSGDSGSPILRQKGEGFEIVGMHVSTRKSKGVKFGQAVMSGAIRDWAAGPGKTAEKIK